MKKLLITSLAVTLCTAILLCISLGSLVSMSDRIESLTNTVENLRKNVEEMNSELSSMEWELTEIREAADSLLTLEDVTPGDFHPETGTVDIHLQLLPKIVTEDMELTVTLEDQTLVLTRHENIFTGVLNVDLFDEAEPVLTVTSSVGIQTQTLEAVRSCVFYKDYLPEVWRNMFGVSDGPEGKTMLDVGFCFDRSMLLPEVSADFESVTLIRHRNGQEDHRQDITKMLRETGEEGMTEYTTSFLIGLNEEVLVQVIAVDTYGYVHQMTVQCCAEENYEDTAWVQGETYQICDPAGNVLYNDSF